MDPPRPEIVTPRPVLPLPYAEADLDGGTAAITTGICWWVVARATLSLLGWVASVGCFAWEAVAVPRARTLIPGWPIAIGLPGVLLDAAMAVAAAFALGRHEAARRWLVRLALAGAVIGPATSLIDGLYYADAYSYFQRSTPYALSHLDGHLVGAVYTGLMMAGLWLFFRLPAVRHGFRRG